MALPGIDPGDPTPGHKRQLIVAAGEGAGGPPTYKVLLFGNKTSGGSEAVDTLGTIVLDAADAEARMGTRSELFAMYMKFVEVDSGAQIFFIAVTESAGSAADVDFTFTGAATAVGTIEVHVHGQTFEVAVAEGDANTVVSVAVDAAIPGADEGRLQVTSSESTGVVNVVYIHAGPRGDLTIGSGTTRGVRMTSKVAGITIVKETLTAGATEDDATLAYAAAAAGEFYLWVLPFHSTGAITATDNQIGEAIRGPNGVVTSALPINGKEQTVHIGLVGTQAEATTVSTSTGGNSARAYFYRAENNDLNPAMIAAHNAAVFRSLVQAHPAMIGPVGAKGSVGYTSTDLTVYNMPDPFVVTDRPGAQEIRADLDNGITPIAFDANGRASIPRIITSRSQNANGDNDYRAREGHITPVTDFFWDQVEQIYGFRLQPIIADNVQEGQTPTARTTTPSQVVDILREVITDGVGSTPVGAIFVGPYLAPDKEQKMLDSAKSLKFTGGFTAEVDINAAEHLIKSETTVRETSAAY